MKTPRRETSPPSPAGSIDMSRKKPTWVEVERFLRRINKHPISPNTMYLPEIAFREAFKVKDHTSKNKSQAVTWAELQPFINDLFQTKIETPKDVPVFKRGEKKSSGRTTGKAYRCRMDGCCGYRIIVKWNNGTCTQPCSKGMNMTKKGWRIL